MVFLTLSELNSRIFYETQCIIQEIASKYTNMKVIKTEKITSNSDRVYYMHIQTRH